ncbi:hypothetical protein [Olsenella uli]|uniref:hypothetical protein n=1 Tax=Olsenella uli TaxID=133926 RepID=UPI0021C811AF|nr:hypothetical protein [Olsenella uli]
MSPEEVMAARPLADIRASDVIREAGCSHGSLYRSFAHRVALVTHPEPPTTPAD